MKRYHDYDRCTRVFAPNKENHTLDKLLILSNKKYNYDEETSRLHPAIEFEVTFFCVNSDL